VQWDSQAEGTYCIAIALNDEVGLNRIIEYVRGIAASIEYISLLIRIVSAYVIVLS
jgi:hypothetical protein